MKDPLKELALAGVGKSEPQGASCLQGFLQPSPGRSRKQAICQQRGVSLKGEQTNKGGGVCVALSVTSEGIFSTPSRKTVARTGILAI